MVKFACEVSGSSCQSVSETPVNAWHTAPVVLSLGPLFPTAWGSLLITKAFCIPHSCAVEGKAAKRNLGTFADSEKSRGVFMSGDLSAAGSGLQVFSKAVPVYSKYQLDYYQMEHAHRLPWCNRTAPSSFL